MTRTADVAAGAFVTGAMMNAGCTLAPHRQHTHDPCVVMFDVPGMGRVRVHVEAVHTDHDQETRHGGTEDEA